MDSCTDCLRVNQFNPTFRQKAFQIAIIRRVSYSIYQKYIFYHAAISIYNLAVLQQLNQLFTKHKLG